MLLSCLIMTLAWARFPVVINTLVAILRVSREKGERKVQRVKMQWGRLYSTGTRAQGVLYIFKIGHWWRAFSMLAHIPHSWLFVAVPMDLVIGINGVLSYIAQL